MQRMDSNLKDCILEDLLLAGDRSMYIGNPIAASRVVVVFGKQLSQSTLANLTKALRQYIANQEPPTDMKKCLFHHSGLALIYDHRAFIRLAQDLDLLKSSKMSSLQSPFWAIRIGIFQTTRRPNHSWKCVRGRPNP